MMMSMLRADADTMLIRSAAIRSAGQHEIIIGVASMILPLS